MINKIVFVAVSFLWCSAAVGQSAVVNPEKGTTVQLPKFAITKVSTVVSVPDGGMTHWDTRRNRKPKTSREVLALETLPAYLQSHVCSKVTTDGKTVYLKIDKDAVKALPAVKVKR